MFWAMIWIVIRVVSWVTTGSLRTLYNPQDGPPPPLASLIPDPSRTFDCTPTSSSTPGLSTPPFPNHPRHGPPFRTECNTASRRGLCIIAGDKGPTEGWPAHYEQEHGDIQARGPGTTPPFAPASLDMNRSYGALRAVVTLSFPLFGMAFHNP